MSYGKYLLKQMDNKNINSTQLAELIGVDPSYISKIINGVENPPLEKVNKKIAKALEIDERKLNIESYYDRAPNEIKQMIHVIIKAMLTPLFSVLKKMQDNDSKKITDETLKETLEVIKEQPISEIIISLIDDENMIIKNSEEYGEMLQIQEINAEGKVTAILRLLETISFLITDNGMAPNIPLNSRVKIEIKEKYSQNDIVCLKSENGVILRSLNINGDYYMFMPYNSEYKTMTFTKEDAEKKIIGRAKEVILKL